MGTVMMADNGRLVVPAGLRQQLGLPKGGKLIAAIRGGVLMLEPFDAAVRRAQAKARSYLKATGDDSVVDEFLAERRHAASEEDVG